MDLFKNLGMASSLVVLNLLMFYVHGIFAFITWQNQEFGRNPSKSNPNCTCGYDDPTSLLYKEWILSVDVFLGDESWRTCVGTIVNSNMVLTSHHCFIKETPVNIYELWQNPVGKDGSSLITNPIWVTLRTFPRNTTVGRNRTFSVKKLIFREHFIQEYNYRKFSKALEYDTAIIIADADFNYLSGNGGDGDPIWPICLPRAGEAEAENLHNLEAFYQGLKFHPGHPDPWRLTTGSNFEISTAHSCNPELKLGFQLPKNDTDLLCLKFMGAGPSQEGGPIRIRRDKYVEGGNPRSFLVGIGGITKGAGLNNDDPNFVIFSNINRHVSYLERIAHKEGSEWCATPNFDDGKLPWVYYEKSQNMSLDCGKLIGRRNQALIIKYSSCREITKRPPPVFVSRSISSPRALGHSAGGTHFWAKSRIYLYRRLRPYRANSLYLFTQRFFVQPNR